MALADIVRRIETEARDEAERLIADAEARAVALRADAAHAVAEQRAQSLARAKHDAELDAAAVVASARLSARDAALTSRRAVVEDALAAVVAGLESLPPERYAQFLATRIAEQAHGGETVAVASEDTTLRETIAQLVENKRPELDLSWSDEPAEGMTRGVVLAGDRVRASISAASVVADRHDALELELATLLFGDGEG